MGKLKIINDPIYGFIRLQQPMAEAVLAHPWFQRLRYIQQLGLSDIVFPGAVHTRFQHALGAYHLMGKALDALSARGTRITAEESDAAQLAILLHDIGHGPFSHALEETLLPGIRHESLTYLMMGRLNEQLGGGLDLTMRIFRNGYKRKFFHQLVSSQLDMDRLDYLKRDSFYSGVPEGSIGVERILELLNTHQDQLVIVEKGIYSVENFLFARRFMYWQVYLHKAAVSAERMLVNLIRRARYLSQAGERVPASEALHVFMSHDHTLDDFHDHPSLLDAYGQLDDHDIWGAIKNWTAHRDPILSALCRQLLDREIFQISMSNEGVSKAKTEHVRAAVARQYGVMKRDTNFLFSHGSVSNEAYVSEGQPIHIQMQNGSILDIAAASELPHIRAMSKIVKKHFICWPKNLNL
ncbi:MAG: HD domain-containing protein [Cyclobacteriaceae bacterium]|nr:HD domain-containing protein [Cyclobacteriaceae bacterium]